METRNEALSDAGEAEDIPSDFFDDFNRAEFMDGLSVIDECSDDNSGIHSRRSLSRQRIVMDTLDSVKDLRELIRDNNDDDNNKDNRKHPYQNNKKVWRKPVSPKGRELDDLIRPGSRRDPNKTNEAIKKDKEVKVKQFLAKSLNATDDLRPPGTELDDYEGDQKKDINTIRRIEDVPSSSQKKSVQSAHQSRVSPRTRRSPISRYSSRVRYSPRLRHSPRSRRSPPHNTYQRPRQSPQYNSRKRSPIPFRNPDRRYSPLRDNRRNRSPLRRSPHRLSPTTRNQRRQYSRSPRPRRLRRSYSRSPLQDDNFLYPNNSNMLSLQGHPPYHPEYSHQYAHPVPPEFPGGDSGYQYPQISTYGVGFPDTYSYGTQAPVPSMPAPAPVIPNTVPSMVPAPSAAVALKATPYDALAQLVAEGKISQEDYLKLTPNKGVTTALDANTRVMVLTRCHEAFSKLDKLHLPNRLTINNQTSLDEKCLPPKYCSPLKRQIITEFSFSKESFSPEQQTKQLVECIISTLGLDKVVSSYKKKLPKNMKDVAVQTTKLQCEVCEIRESTKRCDIETSTEPEYFSSSVHTQVVEKDLISSKSIFNPSGSITDGATISIAHLTPAQLVSQLAARAKTLKQPQEPPSSNQYNRRQNYEYDGRSGQQYQQSYSNYRY